MSSTPSSPRRWLTRGSPFGGISKLLPLLTERDSSVMVIGAGGLGQFAIKYLRALTPATIIAIDTEGEKRAHALEIGADHALDSRATDLADQFHSVLTDGLGVTACIDFVGIDATLSLASGVVVARGRSTLVGIEQMAVRGRSTGAGHVRQRSHT